MSYGYFGGKFSVDFFFHTYGEFISEMLVTDTKIYKTDNIVLIYNILL